jgi:signal transduction histidine kinase
MSEVVAGFRELIASRLAAEHRTIAGRWLERLVDLLPLEARDVFPTHALLDHIPSLIVELATYLRNPSDQAIGANTTVIAKAQELGHLRHVQGAALHQLIQEYRILGAILKQFVKDETAQLPFTPEPSECMDVLADLDECVGVLLQTTVDTFVTAYTETIEQQNERLEGFNRMVSHELRQPLGTLQFAVAALRMPDTLAESSKLNRVLALVDRNVRSIVDLTRKLESISRMHSQDDTAQRQRVELSAIASEVALQLHDMAEARGVEIRVSTELPIITIDVGRLQLVLMNLLSNAIKYSDPAKPVRFVEIAPAPAPADNMCQVLVRDNGLGIEPDHLSGLFGRFFRAHSARDQELGTDGLGLGLSIVADCLEAVLGRISVESVPGEGTTFSVVLPMGELDPVAHQQNADC